MIEEIRKKLLEQGENPDDFIITIKGNTTHIYPKWFYEIKKVAKNEDKPIIADINDVAELTTFTAIDKDELAEMLVYALIKIDELEARING